LITVQVVAIEAANLPMVHIALHKIVALHTILVSGQVGELIEVGCAMFELFQLPIVREPLPR
jgi:hypothetical protein